MQCPPRSLLDDYSSYYLLIVSILRFYSHLMCTSFVIFFVYFASQHAISSDFWHWLCSWQWSGHLFQWPVRDLSRESVVS